MYADADAEVQEMIQCPDCYRHSNEKFDEHWFAKPCARKQHELVFAKMTGFPYWPAKVIKVYDGNYDVRFFGRVRSRYILEKSHLKPITEDIIKLNGARPCEGLRFALDELEIHQKLLKQPASNFLYENEGGLREMVKRINSRRQLAQGQDATILLDEPMELENVFNEPNGNAARQISALNNSNEFVTPGPFNIPAKKPSKTLGSDPKPKRRDYRSSTVVEPPSHKKNDTETVPAQLSQTLSDVAKKIESNLLSNDGHRGKKITDPLPGTSKLNSKIIQKVITEKNMAPISRQLEEDLSVSDDDDEDETNVANVGGQEYHSPKFPPSKSDKKHERSETEKVKGSAKKKRTNDSGFSTDGPPELECQTSSRHKRDELKSAREPSAPPSSSKKNRSRSESVDGRSNVRTNLSEYFKNPNEIHLNTPQPKKRSRGTSNKEIELPAVDQSRDYVSKRKKTDSNASRTGKENGTPVKLTPIKSSDSLKLINPVSASKAKNDEFQRMAMLANKINEQLKETEVQRDPNQSRSREQSFKSEADAHMSAEQSEISRKLRHIRSCLDVIDDIEQVKRAAVKLIKLEAETSNKKLRRQNMLIERTLENAKKMQWCFKCSKQCNNFSQNFCSAECQNAHVVDEYEKLERKNILP